MTQVIRLKPTPGSKARSERAANDAREAAGAVRLFIAGEEPERIPDRLAALIGAASSAHGQFDPAKTCSILGKASHPLGVEAIRQIKSIASAKAQRVFGGASE